MVEWIRIKVTGRVPQGKAKNDSARGHPALMLFRPAVCPPLATRRQLLGGKPLEVAIHARGGLLALDFFEQIDGGALCRSEPVTGGDDRAAELAGHPPAVVQHAVASRT